MYTEINVEQTLALMLLYLV